MKTTKIVLLVLVFLSVFWRGADCRRRPKWYERHYVPCVEFIEVKPWWFEK